MELGVLAQSLELVMLQRDLQRADVLEVAGDVQGGEVGAHPGEVLGGEALDGRELAGEALLAVREPVGERRLEEAAASPAGAEGGAISLEQDDVPAGPARLASTAAHRPVKPPPTMHRSASTWPASGACEAATPALSNHSGRTTAPA